MAIKIKLSEKYTGANTKRIGTYVVGRKWKFVSKEIAIIAEKFDPKGNLYELQKAISDLKPEPIIEISKVATVKETVFKDLPKKKKVKFKKKK